MVLAIFKFDRMDWAIEKCTELGVSRIVPVIARRTDSHLAAASSKRVERWQRIARQASEQSRRVAPPEITSPVKLRRNTETFMRSLRVVLAESEEQTLLRDVVTAQSRKRRNCSRGWPRGRMDRRRIAIISPSWMDFSLAGQYHSPRRDGRNSGYRNRGVRLALPVNSRFLRASHRGGILGRNGCLQITTSFGRRSFPTTASAKRSSMFTDRCWLSPAPGTGKTSVLIHRIARLVQQGHAKPEEVLALTYTVAAAGEMRDRVRTLLGKPIHSATFHDYCLDLLKRAGKNFGVLDDCDLWIYLRKRVHELHLQHYVRAANVGQFLRDLLDFLRRCHDELVTPEKYAEYVARLQRGESIGSDGSRNQKTN